MKSPSWRSERIVLAKALPCTAFFFSLAAKPDISTLSLHDALPILGRRGADRPPASRGGRGTVAAAPLTAPSSDRKSTRLNSSHTVKSYAVFCLKKKKDNLLLNNLPSHI